MNKKTYTTGLILLTISIAMPFVINIFNNWPSVKRLGAVIIITGLIFSFALAIFLKKQDKLS